MATLAAATSDAYKQQSILTAPPGRLVVMLYDGCIRFLFQAAYAMRQGDRKVSLQRLRKAEAIIDELNSSLDMSYGQIPGRLRSIYLFCKRHLIRANVETDASAIDTVVRLLSELREAWEQVVRSAELVA